MSTTNTDPVFTITQFCARNKIGRSLYYTLQRAGRGPDEMELGGAKRISAEAEIRWRARMESKAEGVAA
jgi:hypothetical protein